MAEIKVRDVPEQTLLTEQTYVNAAQLPEWIAKAGMRQLKAAADIGGQVGPSLVIYNGEVNADSDGPVEAGLPIAAERAGETTLPTRTEPAHREGSEERRVGEEPMVRGGAEEYESARWRRAREVVG